MTSALEGGEWSAARPGRTLTTRKTLYTLYRRLGGSQGRSRRGGKSRLHLDSIPDSAARSQSIPTELPGPLIRTYTWPEKTLSYGVGKCIVMKSKECRKYLQIFSGFTSGIVWCWNENQFLYFWKTCTWKLSVRLYVVSLPITESLFWEYASQQWISYGSQRMQLSSGCNVDFFYGKSRHSD